MVDSVAQKFKEEYERGEISKQQYEYTMEILGIAREEADANGNFSVSDTDIPSYSGGASSSNESYECNAYVEEHTVWGSGNDGNEVDNLDGYRDSDLVGLRYN